MTVLNLNSLETTFPPLAHPDAITELSKILEQSPSVHTLILPDVGRGQFEFLSYKFVDQSNKPSQSVVVSSPIENFFIELPKQIENIVFSVSLLNSFVHIGTNKMHAQIVRNIFDTLKVKCLDLSALDHPRVNLSDPGKIAIVRVLLSSEFLKQTDRYVKVSSRFQQQVIACFKQDLNDPYSLTTFELATQSSEMVSTAGMTPGNSSIASTASSLNADSVSQLGQQMPVAPLSSPKNVSLLSLALKQQHSATEIESRSSRSNLIPTQEPDAEKPGSMPVPLIEINMWNDRQPRKEEDEDPFWHVFHMSLASP